MPIIPLETSTGKITTIYGNYDDQLLTVTRNEWPDFPDEQDKRKILAKLVKNRTRFPLNDEGFLKKNLKTFTDTKKTNTNINKNTAKKVKYTSKFSSKQLKNLLITNNLIEKMSQLYLKIYTDQENYNFPSATGMCLRCYGFSNVRNCANNENAQLELHNWCHEILVDAFVILKRAFLSDDDNNFDWEFMELVKKSEEDLFVNRKRRTKLLSLPPPEPETIEDIIPENPIQFLTSTPGPFRNKNLMMSDDPRDHFSSLQITDQMFNDMDDYEGKEDNILETTAKARTPIFSKPKRKTKGPKTTSETVPLKLQYAEPKPAPLIQKLTYKTLINPNKNILIKKPTIYLDHSNLPYCLGVFKKTQTVTVFRPSKLNNKKTKFKLIEKTNQIRWLGQKNRCLSAENFSGFDGKQARISYRLKVEACDDFSWGQAFVYDEDGALRMLRDRRWCVMGWIWV